ncbi:unnamed protein product [Polarella glacialis]|uniref:50S ribosomal protein L22, chloroplastic n=1 Tax=Polarella glacialis TaxID=89957 RepID=A0A813HCF5_POLGL|nr:unnamed protein product [Polarella glacialis]
MWSALSVGSRRVARRVAHFEETSTLKVLASVVTSLSSRDVALVPAQVPASSASAPLFQRCGLGASSAVRGFYFPRKNWFPWRVRIIHQRQAACRQKRHIWPRRKDPDEAGIFGAKEDGTQLAFRDKELRISMRKLLDYARIIRNKQIQDAIDWVESMARMKSEVILKLLRKAVKDCVEKRKMDISRLYIFDAQPMRGFFVKSLRKHSRGNYGVVKSPRNMFMIRIREMPLEEYFHRIYIYNKVPRGLAADMRLALHQNRVSPQMQKEWSPYLCASSRMFHRKELKWLDCTRQFDYYEARRDWIRRYQANLMRASSEAREARGLPALVGE